LKQLILFLLCFTLTLTAKEKVHKKLTIGVKSKDCDGTGICSIKTASITNADFIYDDAKQILRIIFQQQNLLETEQLHKLENHRYFDMQESFELPLDLLKELDMPAEYNTIRKGRYLITVSEGEFIVSIPMAAELN
jgi:hypothetical protein